MRTAFDAKCKISQKNDTKYRKHDANCSRSSCSRIYYIYNIWLYVACLLKSEGNACRGRRARRAAVIVACRHDLLQKVISINQAGVCDFGKIATCVLWKTSREDHHHRHHHRHRQHRPGRVCLCLQQNQK